MKRIQVFTLALLLAVSTAVSADDHGRKEQERDEHFPFFPSLLNTVTGKPIASSEFEDPAVCQGCHPELYKQWKGSMHSAAFDDPVFQALWRLGVKETDGAVEKLCAGCHTAIGTVAEEVRLGADGVFQASAIAKKGVQCDLCHTIKASTSGITPTREPENASVIVEPGSVKRGPYKDADSPYHETEYSDLHTRSEFCANCHNVFHPFNHFPIENTYYEWKNSVYAQAGIQCQDCHMMPVEKAVEAARTMKRPVNPGRAAVGGPARENVWTHEFVGGNAVVTDLLGAKKHAEIAVQRLQSAASLELQLPKEAKAGNIVRFKVRVKNETAGHNLPTSLTEVRQVWVEVQVKAGAAEVFHSGHLEADGALDHEAAVFNAAAVDKDGHHTVKPWEIVRFESNTTIPPKGSALVPYSFQLPADAKGPLQVSATLHYRSYDQTVANLLLGEKAPRIPVIDMVSASGEIPFP
jgi:hypothetical protein